GQVRVSHQDRVPGSGPGRCERPYIRPCFGMKIHIVVMLSQRRQCVHLAKIVVKRATLLPCLKCVYKLFDFVATMRWNTPRMDVHCSEVSFEPLGKFVAMKLNIPIHAGSISFE